MGDRKKPRRRRRHRRRGERRELTLLEGLFGVGWARALQIGIALAALLLAAAGGAWYVATPSVVSYQASSLLTLPAFVMVLVWLHRRLPIRVQWGLAIALVFVGPVGYLMVGGAQWWNWGQMTPLPLVLLILLTAGDDDDPTGTAGVTDGPWGPP